MHANKHSKQLRKNVAVIIICAIFIITSFATYLITNSKSIDCKISYYFVYCYKTDGKSTALSYSYAMQNFGGSGYILEYDNKYYVTAACYYSYDDAVSVCEKLEKHNISCEMYCAERSHYKLTTTKAKKQAELYKGIIKTLYEISAIFYKCANGLDTGGYNYNEVNNIIQNVRTTLSGLVYNADENCFLPYLSQIVQYCDDYSGDTIYSGNLRTIQIYIADTLLNITLK